MQPYAQSVGGVTNIQVILNQELYVWFGLLRFIYFNDVMWFDFVIMCWKPLQIYCCGWNCTEFSIVLVRCKLINSHDLRKALHLKSHCVYTVSKSAEYDAYTPTLQNANLPLKSSYM